MGKLPCAKDCPNRSVGCHAKCEAYLTWRKAKDEQNEAKRSEWVYKDYCSTATYRKRFTLKYTETGRKAVSYM